MSTQAINILKLLLSIIFDPICEGTLSNQDNKVDISDFLFTEEQTNAFFDFLGLLDKHTPLAFRDYFFRPEDAIGTSSFWLESAAQGEALLKSLYLLPHFIPNLTSDQEKLLSIYSQMAVLMMINSSNYINKDLDLDLVQNSWYFLIHAFETTVTDNYNINGFIGTLPLHTMVHTPQYLKMVGPLKTFSTYATEKLVKPVEDPEQNDRHPVTSLLNNQINRYVIKLIFMSQTQPEILQSRMKVSNQIGKWSTKEELKLLDGVKKSLVYNYSKFRNATNQTSSQTASSFTMDLSYDKDTTKSAQNELDPNKFYYQRYSRFNWNTSKYTAVTNSSESSSTNELSNFVRVNESKNSSASQSPSYYAKLIDCFCVRRKTEQWDRFAIVEKIPPKSLKNIQMEKGRNFLAFGDQMKLGVYWENKYKKGEKVVVPLSRIANPVFIIPQYNLQLSKSKKVNRFFILDPNMFLEFYVGSKACQLMFDEHQDINKKEIDYLQKHLINKDSVVIKK